MYLIIFLQSLVFYGAISTIYRQEKGLSMSQIFIIESIYFIVVIALEVPWGYIADKIGYKKTLIISNFIYFLSKIVFYKACSLTGFLIERIFLAIALSGLSGCDSAYLYNSISDKSLSDKVFSKYNFYSILGFLVASITSSLIVQFSINSTVVLTIISYGIAFILSLFLDEVSTSRDSVSIKKNFKEVFNNKKMFIFIISITLISEVVQSITVYLNQNKYINCGINIKYFGVILAFSQIICLITGKAYSLKNFIGEKKYIITLYIVILISSFTLVKTKVAIISIISVLMISASDALLTPIVMDIENKSITTGDRATVLSIYSVIGSIFSAIVNPIVGISADYSLIMSFVICIIMVSVALVLMIIFYKYKE